MKSALLVLCALGYGFLPTVFELPYTTLFTLFMPILLGLIYFVLHQHDWPPRIVSWLFACIAISRVAGYWWLNSSHGRVGPIVDLEVWLFGGLAALGFVYAWWRQITGSPPDSERSESEANVS
jgi:hypothetical protein